MSAVQFAFVPQADEQIVIPVRELPLKERPVERLYNFGPGALCTMEVLANIVGGSRQIEIAIELQRQFKTVSGIARASIHELTRVPFLGRAGAARIKAALELARRLETDREHDRPQVRSPADAANLVMAEMRLLEQEHLRLIKSVCVC